MEGAKRMASSLRRPTIVSYKSALATIGLCAVAAMGAFGFHADASLGEISARTAQEPPHTMTLGNTRTASSAPPRPLIASAKPRVTAMPAPGTRPGM
jgi:hypothetical protein